jgi:hypothetical protein
LVEKFYLLLTVSAGTLRTISRTFCSGLKLEKYEYVYSLAELYVKSVCLNLFGSGGDLTFTKHFKGGARYTFWEPLP